MNSRAWARACLRPFIAALLVALCACDPGAFDELLEDEPRDTGGSGGGGTSGSAGSAGVGGSGGQDGGGATGGTGGSGVDAGNDTPLEVTVSTGDCYESTPTERVEKLNDGLSSTKFVARSNSVWVRLDAGAPVVLQKYALTSGSDAPERDPVSWLLMGSNDGKNWTDLDMRIGEDFPTREERREFEITSAIFYRYYVWRAENDSLNVTQVAELELYGVSPLVGMGSAAPAAPQNLGVSATSRDQITLSWQDPATDEIFFQVEQSLDEMTWSTVGYTAVSSAAFIVTDLEPQQAYYYRVHAENGAGASGYSNVVRAQTLDPISSSVNTNGSVYYFDDAYSLSVENDDTSLPDETIRGFVNEFFATYPALSLQYNPEASHDEWLIFDSTLGFPGTVVDGNATISSTHAQEHPKDVGFIVHLGYRVVALEATTPGWAATGLADYARYKFGTRNEEACWCMQRYEAGHAYSDGYGVTGRFFLWLETNLRAGITVELSNAMRFGEYIDDSWWIDATGKSVDVLFEEYAADTQRPPVRYE